MVTTREWSNEDGYDFKAWLKDGNCICVRCRKGVGYYGFRISAYKDSKSVEEKLIAIVKKQNQKEKK